MANGYIGIYVGSGKVVRIMIDDDNIGSLQWQWQWRWGKEGNTIYEEQGWPEEENKKIVENIYHQENQQYWKQWWGKWSRKTKVIGFHLRDGIVQTLCRVCPCKYIVWHHCLIFPYYDISDCHLLYIHWLHHHHTDIILALYHHHGMIILWPIVQPLARSQRGLCWVRR